MSVLTASCSDEKAGDSTDASRRPSPAALPTGSVPPPEDLRKSANDFLTKNGVSVRVDGDEIDREVIAQKMSALLQNAHRDRRRSVGSDEASDLELARQAVASSVLGNVLYSEAKAAGREISLAEAEEYRQQAEANGSYISGSPGGGRLEGQAASVAYQGLVTIDRERKRVIGKQTGKDADRALQRWFEDALRSHDVRIVGLDLTPDDLPKHLS